MHVLVSWLHRPLFSICESWVPGFEDETGWIEWLLWDNSRIIGIRIIEVLGLRGRSAIFRVELKYSFEDLNVGHLVKTSCFVEFARSKNLC